MVTRRRLVTAGSNGSRGVITANDVCQMFGQQRIDALLTVFSQCRGIVTGIQDEVRLFQRQRVGIGTAPLFQHLVAYRPYQDTGMIPVAQHHIGQVALMPFVEETGIVVLCLTATPHIK